jgi:hypothetical protein
MASDDMRDRINRKRDADNKREDDLLEAQVRCIMALERMRDKLIALRRSVPEASFKPQPNVQEGRMFASDYMDITDDHVWHNANRNEDGRFNGHNPVLDTGLDTAITYNPFKQGYCWHGRPAAHSSQEGRLSAEVAIERFKDDVAVWVVRQMPWEKQHHDQQQEKLEEYHSQQRARQREKEAEKMWEWLGPVLGGVGILLTLSYCVAQVR